MLTIQLVLCKKFAGHEMCRLYSLLLPVCRSVASLRAVMHPSLRGVVVLGVTRSVSDSCLVSVANMGVAMPRHGACAVGVLAERSDVRLINGCIEDAFNESRPQDKIFFWDKRNPHPDRAGASCVIV